MEATMSIYQGFVKKNVSPCKVSIATIFTIKASQDFQRHYCTRIRLFRSTATDSKETEIDPRASTRILERQARVR